MKVVLIHALNQRMKDSFENDQTITEEDGVFEYPPFSIAYLGAVLEQKNIKVKLFDDLIHTEQEIRNAMSWSDIVGISAMTPNAQRALVLAKKARECGKLVLVGGAHATSCPEYFLESGLVDFVVKGEGERTLPELIACLDGGGDKFHISGIGFMDKGKPFFTKPRDLIVDLDSIPYPAWHLLPMDRYFKRQVGPRRMIMFSSRGCYYNCAYCNKRMSSRKFRIRSSQNIVDEMELIRNRYGVHTISFLDDLFTGNRKHTVRLCQEIIRRDLNLEWTCLTHTEHVDLPLLRLMRDAGCIKIEYGVESGSPKILDSVNKKYNLDNIVAATRAARNVGIKAKFYIIIGFPGETMSDVRQTKDIIWRAKPSSIGVFIFNPFPGSRIYEKIKERITVTDYADYAFIKRGPVCRHEHFSHEQLRRM